MNTETYLIDEEAIEVDELCLEKDKRRASRRKKNASKAMRKFKLASQIYGKDGWHYKSLHQYSKNRIHCSCQMCRFRPAWDPDQKVPSDIRKENHADYLIKEFNRFGFSDICE